MNTLQKAAFREFCRWAQYRMWTACSRCGEIRYAGKRRSAGPWLCLECWDQEPRR